jgi:tetratricopeptide (TPR) repeat protein
MTVKTLKQSMLGAVILLTLNGAALADAHHHSDLMTSIAELQKGWAEVNYQSQGDEQISGFAELVAAADAVVAANADAAPAYIWRGIIESTYAGAKGGLGALKLAKAAKADLEKALEIEPDAMNGSAYTSLGTLYFNVPGWPIGFGSDKKAEKLLLQALTLNPDGIDSNYFYANFLQSKGRDSEAKTFYLKAQNAAPRADRPLADAGRQKEIAEALATLKAE